MILWESKFTLKIEPDGTNIFGPSDESWPPGSVFFKWQGPGSSVPHAILNHGGWPGGTGLIKLLVKSYSATPRQVQ